MREKFKKMFVLITCLCLIVTMAACGQEKTSESSELSGGTSHEEEKQDDKTVEEAINNLEKMKAFILKTAQRRRLVCSILRRVFI